MCIQDTFAPLLQSCSSLAAAGADTNKKTNEILAQVFEAFGFWQLKSTQMHYLINEAPFRRMKL